MKTLIGGVVLSGAIGALAGVAMVALAETPAQAFWTSVGGTAKWCNAIPDMQAEAIAHPSIDVRIQSRGSYDSSGNMVWEAWLTPWDDVEFAGPVPEATVYLWHDIGATLRANCRWLQ